MFKYLSLFFLLTFVTLLRAAPALDKALYTDDAVPTSTEKESSKFIHIIESDNEKKDDGSYSFSFRGADGTFREEQAVIVNPGSKDQHLEVTGSYGFIGDNGEEVSVHYKANEKGFVPVGSHIPEEISKVAQLAADLPKLRTHDDQKGVGNNDQQQ